MAGDGTPGRGPPGDRAPCRGAGGGGRAGPRGHRAGSPGGRLKYETMARTILGTALVALGRGEEGLAELRAAVEGADRLGTPSGRWEALAAMAHALYATGDDAAASASLRSAEVIRAFAESLTKEHSDSLLAAPHVREILSATS